MDQEIWQQLLSLESSDLTRQWFSKIHGRELSTRRVKEINSAAKQSREYFRNASNSNNSVRPLLTFYGVASLSRSLLLLLKREGGEETLATGHGLTTVDWGEQLSGDPSIGLQALLKLKIQTSSGLFSDFVKETKNRLCIHINSSGVQWGIDYDIPEQGKQITLGDLIARIPDLFMDYSNISPDIRYSPIGGLSFDQQDGFKADVRGEHFINFKDAYQNMGYKIEIQEKLSTISCDAETFQRATPLFIHAYVQKTFGTIPNLHIAEPFEDSIAFSQLGITYMVAYYLGMLVRYYPTHWISLSQGDRGDGLWPTINRAQHFVEQTFPELTIEMIYDSLKENKS